MSAKAIERRWQTLDTFTEDVASLVSSIDDEYEITNQVAARLSGLLASDYLWGSRTPLRVLIWASMRPARIH